MLLLMERNHNFLCVVKSTLHARKYKSYDPEGQHHDAPFDA